jgi:hypothetical protein
MTDEEFRAIIAAGPAVVMVESRHMIALLDERDGLRAENARLRESAELNADYHRREMKLQTEIASLALEGSSAIKAENARLREALENSAIMIQGCYDAPTNPDSLPQMLLHYIRAALEVKP